MAKPVDGVDEVVFDEYGAIVPSNYSETGQNHQPGKHYCCNKGMGQGSGGNDIDLLGLTLGSGYDPGAGFGLFGWVSKTLDAEATINNGGNTEINLDGHGFAVGDYVTIGGTVWLNGEWRISAVTTDTFTIPLAYIAETPPTTATAVARKPLRIGIAANYEIVFASNCTAYIEASHDTLNVEKVDFNSVSGLLHLSSDVVGSHNFNEIRARNTGTLIIANDAEFTKLIMTKDAVGSTVVVGEGCLGPSAVSCDLEIDGGSLTWDSKMGDGDINGGTVEYCANVSLGTDVNIDLLNFFGSGTFNWYGKSRLYDLDVRGGTLTALGGGIKSIDSGTTKDFPIRGGTVDLTQAGGPLTLGTNNNFDYQGGSLLVPKKTTVSF